MKLKLRKFIKAVDRTYIEGGKKAPKPVELVMVAAVINNPWSGRGFVKNLMTEDENIRKRIDTEGFESLRKDLPMLRGIDE